MKRIPILLLALLLCFGSVNVRAADRTTTAIPLPGQSLQADGAGTDIYSLIEKIIDRLQTFLKENRDVLEDGFRDSIPEDLLDSIPGYAGNAAVQINGGEPFFPVPSAKTGSFEKYGAQDRLGRCGSAVACISPQTMPADPIGSIGMIKPAGWHTVKYDFIEGKYLYNRCHLIGYQLTAEGANAQNLITGTRYLNTVGMLPYENAVASYVSSTGNHVLYRVTPLYRGSELLCRGVLMEALSLEDGGKGICFNVFAYNVQPGVIITYADGESRIDESFDPQNGDAPGGELPQFNRQVRSLSTGTKDDCAYIINVNSDVFHCPWCSAVERMSEKNKMYSNNTAEEIKNAGYRPCGICRPQ